MVKQILLLRELRNYLGYFLALFSACFGLTLANHPWFAANSSQKPLRKPLQIIWQLSLLLALLPSFLFAGKFTASVSRNQIPFGESFTLDLTLKDVSARGEPDTDTLNRQFIIHSQQQSSNTVIINGKMSSSQSWRLTMIPQKEGDLTIPPVHIKTAEGILSSEPIAIHVGKGSDAASGSLDKEMTLTAVASTSSPYKSEPFTYTIKLATEKEIANVKIRDFSIDGAIVDAVEQPVAEERVFNGIRHRVITFSYLITPTKPGTLTIPPIVIQGGIPEKRKRRMPSFFDMDLDMDPFDMMRGFQRFKPFALSTEEMILEVQPPVPGVDPWLAARSLNIEEKWEDSQNIRVGEPITRHVAITAEGLRAAQLPNVGELTRNTSSYNIYTDKPELDEQISNRIIKSSRKEQFTLIPQKSGSLTLPAIKIPWWDTAKKERKTAVLPERTLEVMPAPISEHEPSQFAADSAASAERQTAGAVQNHQRDLLIYVLIAVILILLFGAIFWVMMLQRKLARLTGKTENPKASKKETPLPIHLKELTTATSASEIRDFIQIWGHRQWNLPSNASIHQICEEVKKRSPHDIYKEVEILEKTLEDALYNHQEISVKDTAKRFAVVLDQAKVKGPAEEKSTPLPKLNPT